METLLLVMIPVIVFALLTFIALGPERMFFVRFRVAVALIILGVIVLAAFVSPFLGGPDLLRTGGGIGGGRGFYGE